MSFTVGSRDIFLVRGTLDASQGTLTLRDNQLSIDKLTQNDLTSFPVPLTRCFVWYNITSSLPGTAAAEPE